MSWWVKDDHPWQERFVISEKLTAEREETDGAKDASECERRLTLRIQAGRRDRDM